MYRGSKLSMTAVLVGKKYKAGYIGEMSLF